MSSVHWIPNSSESFHPKQIAYSFVFNAIETNYKDIFKWHETKIENVCNHYFKWIVFHEWMISLSKWNEAYFEAFWCDASMWSFSSVCAAIKTTLKSNQCNRYLFFFPFFPLSVSHFFLSLVLLCVICCNFVISEVHIPKFIHAASGISVCVTQHVVGILCEIYWFDF